jgi:osmotically inducible lipoprotein OsmE
MYKTKLLAAFCALAAVTGCATKHENPVDYVTYRNEPLVKQVDVGMTKSQTLTLGGPPSTELNRTVRSGTCNNYVMEKDGAKQVYYVSFDSHDRVDGKGFMTCEQMEHNERVQ